MKKFAYLNLEKLANRFEKKLIAIGAMMSEREAKEVLFDGPVNLSSSDDPHEKLNKIFREKAKFYHPDKHPDSKKEWAEKNFKKINEAYQVLKRLSKSELARMFKQESSSSNVKKDPDKYSSSKDYPPREESSKDKSKSKRSSLFDPLSSKELERIKRRGF